MQKRKRGRFPPLAKSNDPSRGFLCVEEHGEILWFHWPSGTSPDCRAESFFMVARRADSLVYSFC